MVDSTKSTKNGKVKADKNETTRETPQPTARVRGNKTATAAIEAAKKAKEDLKKAKRSAAARRGHATKAAARKERGELTAKENAAVAKKKKAVAKKRKTTKAKAGKGSPGREKGCSTTIKAHQYNAMWEEYCKSQSIQKCAEAAGVGYKTASKYITGKGEPMKGLVPIRERYINAMAEMQEEQELTLAQFQAAQFQDVQRILKMHMGELSVLQKDLVARNDKYEADKKAAKTGEVPLPECPMTLDKLAKSMDTMVRLAEHLLGGADMSIETRDRSRFEGWTKEERDDFTIRGIWPERYR